MDANGWRPTEPVAWQWRQRGPNQDGWQEWHTVGHKPRGPESDTFMMRPLYAAAPIPPADCVINEEMLNEGMNALEDTEPQDTSADIVTRVFNAMLYAAPVAQPAEQDCVVVPREPTAEQFELLVGEGLTTDELAIMRRRWDDFLAAAPNAAAQGESDG